MSELFRDQLATLINKHSRENGSDTPDFILAQYLWDCLEAFDRAVKHRERWYGKGAPADGSGGTTYGGLATPEPHA